MNASKNIQNRFQKENEEEDIMKKKVTLTAVMIAAAVAIGAAGFGTYSVRAGVRDGYVSEEESLAERYPLEAVRQHALAVSEEMDLPDDRLYGIITYGGEDYLMVADEHKEEGHYGVEYIHTYIDTDGVDGYEPEPVDMYFTCPVCGSFSSAIISPNDTSTGRVFWCKCEDPWILGLSIAEEEVR